VAGGDAISPPNTSAAAAGDGVSAGDPPAPASDDNGDAKVMPKSRDAAKFLYAVKFLKTLEDRCLKRLADDPEGRRLLKRHGVWNFSVRRRSAG
jgi:hypothetical protein